MYTHINYQVKKTKPSINWDHVTFDYIATDEDGESFGFQVEPNLDSNEWVSTNFTNIRYLTSFKKGTCDWEDSLIKRPEK